MSYIRKYLNLIKDTVVAFSVVFIYFEILETIIGLGVTDVKIFRFTKSHHGFYYFTGYLKGQKVFIKVDTHLHFLANDVQVYNLANSELKKSLVTILDYTLNDNIQVIIYEYFDGKELTESDIDQRPEMVKDLCNIIMSINSIGLIHRDVKLDNFLVSSVGIKVIDFTFANSLGDDVGLKDLSTNNKKSKKILKMMGGKLKPSDLEWNDFYSLKHIVENLKMDSFNETQKVLIRECIFFLNKNMVNNTYIYKDS